MTATLIQGAKWRGKSRFSSIFKETEGVAAKMGCEIKVPKIGGRQNYRFNLNKTSPEAYYRATIYYPCIDFLITQLSSNFCVKFKNILALESLIPAFHLSNDVDQIVKAALICKDDLKGCNELEIRNEVDLWHRYCKDKDLTLIGTAVETIHVINLNGYKPVLPISTTLLQLLATLPVTSASAERSFSLLKRLKTYLRSTMTEKRLNGLALGNVYKHFKVEINEAVGLFYKPKPRRLQILNWSEE